MTRRSRVFCVEPAQGRERLRWCAQEPIWFHSWAPTCNTCSFMVNWLGVRRRHGWFVYRVECACGMDFIRSRFRLVMGGYAVSWLARGWTGGGLEEQLKREGRRKLSRLGCVSR